MASLLTHAAVAVSLGQAAPRELRTSRKFWWMAVLCSMAPDADVIGFGLGIRYGDLWGHRGMTHSLLFAAVVAGFLGILNQKPKHTTESLRRGEESGTGGQGLGQSAVLAILFFVITASHGVLDAMTNGGLGVAFFSPFDARRYFFPWTPIEVSPIGAGRFFSERGLEVLWSEIVWIWGPALALGILLRAFRGWRRPEANTQMNSS